MRGTFTPYSLPAFTGAFNLSPFFLIIDTFYLYVLTSHQYGDHPGRDASSE
jgi:hypothetical protein